MKYPDPVIGQKLFLRIPSRWNPATEEEHVVTKVGRKYFTTEVSEGRFKIECQFHLGSWKEKTDYTPSRFIYPSRQHFEKEQAMEVLWSELRKTFSAYSAPESANFGKLVRIKTILEEQ